MADRYFDRNGVTAGFGTLTGNWDTTTASWSTSAAGTATPATFTFTNADAAYFGSASVVSTTAGTATIINGVTVTLNGIYTRNLSATPGAQTVAAAGTGNLVFAGTTPFVNLGARGLTVSAPVSGSAGLSLNGSGKYSTLLLTSSSASLTGACNVTQGLLGVFQPTGYLPSSLFVDENGVFLFYGSSSDYSWSVTPSGAGTILISGGFANNGVTFPAAPAAGNISSFAGMVGARAASSTGQENTKIIISELPSQLGFSAYASAATPALSGRITYNGVGHTSSSSVTIDSQDSTSIAALTAGTYALNASGSGPLVLSGAVTRTNSNYGVTPLVTSARMNLTLGGTNTGNNTLSGDISEVGSNSAILGITKVDAGRWVLSGANSSHTGVHTISAGTLSAQSAKALGNATSAGGVTISGTGVLELAGGITLDKSATTFTIHQTSPITSVGDNTVQTAGITLGGTTTFEVTTGNRLAIANSGAISDGASTFGLTKTGDGELALAAFSNTYDGAVTVTAGTLAVGSLGALGAGVATIQLTGNLKYTGSGETLSRATLLNGSAPSFEASGSGTLTVSNLSSSVSAKTLTLKGSNTGANTITSSLTDNSGALSLAKEDAGKWVVKVRTYTGTTVVNGGTLRCEATNSATTTGAVTIGASGTVELITDTLASTGATSGEVLGTGNVTCNGTIKTRGGTTQKGQVRYGGNLTFGAGSSLYIGAAA